MKKTILVGLSALALSTSAALPALAQQPAVTKVAQITINKQVDPQDERDYQEAVKELNEMFEKHRQAMIAEMNQQLDQMHEDMMRVIDERFGRSQQRLNR